MSEKTPMHLRIKTTDYWSLHLIGITRGAQALPAPCEETLPYSIGQLLILDLRAEKVWVGGLVAHGGGERAEDGVQKLEDLVLVDAIPAVSRRLAQWALHGHQQRGDVDEAAHLAEHRPGAVTLTQHR